MTSSSFINLFIHCTSTSRLHSCARHEADHWACGDKPVVTSEHQQKFQCRKRRWRPLLLNEWLLCARHAAKIFYIHYSFWALCHPGRHILLNLHFTEDKTEARRFKCLGPCQIVISRVRICTQVFSNYKPVCFSQSVLYSQVSASISQEQAVHLFGWWHLRWF